MRVLAGVSFAFAISIGGAEARGDDSKAACAKILDKGPSSAAKLKCLLDHPELDRFAAGREERERKLSAPPPSRKIRIEVTEPAHVGVSVREAQLFIESKWLKELKGVDWAVAVDLSWGNPFVAVRSMRPEEPWTLDVAGSLALGASWGEELVAAEAKEVKFDPVPSPRIRTMLADRRRRVRVVGADGKPVAGARVRTGRVTFVTNEEGHAWVSKDAEVWAIGERTASVPSTGEVLKLNRPRQKCRVVDDIGEIIAPTWCDALPPWTEKVRHRPASLRRIDERLVEVRLARTLELRLPGVLPLNYVDDAVLIDASKKRIPLGRLYTHTGMAAGPARIELGMGKDRWCAKIEIGPRWTRATPKFVRCGQGG